MECTTLWGCVAIEVDGRPRPRRTEFAARDVVALDGANWFGHARRRARKEKGPRSLRTEGLAA